MGAVSRLPLRPCRSGRLGVYFLYALSVYIFSISFPVISFSIFVLILGVARLRSLHPVNREAVTRTHFCYFYVFSVFSSHTPLSVERESRQKRFSYSATREAAKWYRCEDSA